MWFLERTAAFAIFFTFLSVQINAYHYKKRACREMAQKLTTQESNKIDTQFFKQCIVDYFHFKLMHNKIMYVPRIDQRKFYDSKKRTYIAEIAKRVERFFIRNGNWYNILQKKDIFKPNSNDCRDLLYVVAAKYIYALYVLKTLRYELTECKTHRNHYSIKNRANVCYIKPHYLTCAEEIELNLLGRNSGSLAALFNQFYKEPIGEDRTVPGFKEDTDILMGVRVSAFSLENVFPEMFKGPDKFYNYMLHQVVEKMKASANMKLLSVVVAIFRMKSYSGKYFNELLSDQSPLRAKTALARAFQHWGVELTSFDSKIKSFMESPHYNYELNYRRRHNIAFELVLGRLESRDEIPSSWVRFLAEHAICLIYNTPVYLTSGAVRHSVIKQKYIRNKNKLILELGDYWQSLLENWAIVTRVYKKECLGNKYKITACLLRMSKSLYLMFDAMVQMRALLRTFRRSHRNERLDEFEDIRAITNLWVLKYRNKGRTKLPTLTPSVEKRPVGMTSGQPFPSLQQDVPFNQSDDFPEWTEPEQTIENGNTATETKPLGKDVEGSDDTKSLTKDAEGAHKTEPLTKDSEGTNKAKLLIEDNEDADDERKTKPLDKNVDESVDSRMEVQLTEKNDGRSSGIYQTSPITPDFLDLAETEEQDNFGNFETPQEIKPLYVDVEAAMSPVKRTLPDEDMEKSLDEDEETTGSSMVEPDHKTNMKYGTAVVVEPHSKVMTNPMDMNDNEQMRSSMDEGKGELIGSRMKENTENSVDSSMTKPQNQDIKETAGSPMRKPLNKDSEESVGSQKAKPLDNDHKESLSSQMTKPLDKNTRETADLPTRKPLDNDMKESAGAETTKPLEKVTKETAGSPMTKPLDKDTKKTSGSPVAKPLDKDVKETAGMKTEEPRHDDFPEYPTSDAPDIPKKTPQTKSGGKKTQAHPRFYFPLVSYYRRRTTAVSRRRRYFVVGRRRRYSSVARRRRSIYASRRRRISVKPKASTTSQPDETQNIQKFLRKFNCYVEREIRRMIFSEGCMDKIQLSVRKYNRVAFSHFAQLYGKSFTGKKMWKKTKENVVVKTEL